MLAYLLGGKYERVRDLVSDNRKGFLHLLSPWLKSTSNGVLFSQEEIAELSKTPSSRSDDLSIFDPQEDIHKLGFAVKPLT